MKSFWKWIQITYSFVEKNALYETLVFYTKQQKILLNNVFRGMSFLKKIYVI